MNEAPAEAISMTGLHYGTVQDNIQEIEGMVVRLQNLMDSVRENLERDHLENAISLLQAALEKETMSEEGRLTVCHQLIRALLVRFSAYGWIEDLDDCMGHFVKDVGAVHERARKFLLACQGINENVPDVQIAIRFINAFHNSVNIATLDSIVRTATEALASYNTTDLDDILRGYIVKLWIVLGKALVMKYLSSGDIAILHQAAQDFQQAELICPEDTAVVYIPLMALLQVEWLRFIEHGDIGALVRLQNYWRKAAAADAEGAKLYELGADMVEHASDDVKLQEGIAFLTTSLHCRMEDHPRRGHSLGSLASAFHTSFRGTGDLGKLESAIALGREALDLHRPPHPDRSILLYNLANALANRFKHKGTFDDLEECVALHREALGLRQPPHPNRSASLNNLATSLSTRFEHKGVFEDLEESIVLHREALGLRRPPHPDCSDSLNNLASSLSARYKHKGALDDLEECITHHREALDLCQPPHPNRLGSLSNLAASLLTYFEHKGAFEDLEECIALGREALDLHQPSHPDRSILLNNLANSLSTRFQHKGAFDDLEECIALHREALGLRQPPHPNRSTSLDNLATSLRTRYEHNGAFEDLEECIVLHREALRLRQPPHPNCSDSVSNLATSLWIRFEHKGALEDLEECMTLHRQALGLRQPPHPSRSVSLNNLAISFSTRFVHKGASEDLEESIVLHREALDLRQPPHPYRSDSLNNLAGSLWTRFEHKGVFEDLEECIALHREALGLRQPPQPYRSDSLNNLASSLWNRFTHRGDFEDLEECIVLHREALGLRQPAHPNYSASLNNLANALGTRFEHQGAFDDLEECIALNREALALRRPPHPDLSESLTNLGTFLLTRYGQTGNLQDIEEALDHLQNAAKYPTGSVIIRLEASSHWANCAQNHGPLSTLDAYKYSMELLPQLASLDLTLQQRQDVLQHARDLVGNAAKSAINASQYELAVTFLSVGRSIFWSQALHLRSTVDDLMVAKPDIAQKFILISKQLENASYSQHVSALSSSALLAGEPHPGIGTYKRLHLLANERQKIIEEIQNIPGYESFLQPPSFSILQLAAKNGPVILLSISELGCDALIVHGEGSVQHIPLPNIDLRGLQDLKLLLHTPLALEMRTVEIPRNIKDSLRKMLRRDMFLKTSSTSITRDKALQLALEILWIAVVQPIINALGVTKTDTPRRLWWCPTGTFSSLPIHAAGIYSDDNKPIDCLFQYVISSYCTSPQDLLHPPPPITPLFKITAVIEPEAPKAGKLPATLTEFDRIKKHVPDQQHLIAHVGSLSTPNQVNEVVLDIQSSSFVHFGCHGKQSFMNPLESFLLLSGGSLTMSTLIKDCRVPEGALAYLSACETAKADEERPDESLNLVATMMFAGFRGVVGTLWSILDEDAPIVADVFYEHLFRKGEVAPPDVRDAAYGLHLATQKLRDQGKPLYSWVPYVHYGI